MGRSGVFGSVNTGTARENAEGGPCNEPYTGRRILQRYPGVVDSFIRCSGTFDVRLCGLGFVTNSIFIRFLPLSTDQIACSISPDGVTDVPAPCYHVKGIAHGRVYHAQHRAAPVLFRFSV